MNYYETLYIVHPALESGRLKDIILSIQETFSTMNVNILGTDVWGKKKLAYLIDKQKYGTYVLVQFESDGTMNNKISTELEHNPNILSYLTSKIDESELQKDLSSLDEQIGGIRISEPNSETTKEPSEESSEKPSDEPSEESSEESSEEPSEESSDEPSEESSKESNNEKSEENHGTNE